MQFNKYILLAIILFFISNLNSQTLSVNNLTEIDPSTNQEFEVMVSLEDAVDIFGVSFTLSFNKDYIEVTSVSDAGFLGSDLVFFPMPDNENGKVSVGISRKSGQGNISGNGDLVKIIFEIKNVPLQNIITDFTLSDITANDDLGNQISLISSGSTATILSNKNKIIVNSPQEIIGSLNQEFEVMVSLEDAVDIFGVSFTLSFNKDYIEVTSVSDAGFLGSDLVFFPMPDNENGKVSVGISRKSGQGNISGNGDLVKIIFKIKNVPLQNIITDFTLSDITANDELGIEIILNKINSVSQILIVEKPDVINLLSPLNGALGNTVPLNLLWKSSNRSSSYKLEVSKENSFGNTLVEVSGLTDTTYVLNSIEDLTTYYWRVKAVNIGGESDWSETWSFRTLGQPTVVSLLSPGLPPNCRHN